MTRVLYVSQSLKYKNPDSFRALQYNNIMMLSDSLISVQGVASHQEFLDAVSRHQFTWTEGSAALPQHGRHQVPLLQRKRSISIIRQKPFCDYLFSPHRTTLARLVNEGHVFNTIDEHHFKSAD